MAAQSEDLLIKVGETPIQPAVGAAVAIYAIYMDALQQRRDVRRNQSSSGIPDRALSRAVGRPYVPSVLRRGPRMRYSIPALLVALVVGRSTPVPAQLAEWVNQLLTAAQLPVVTAEARREGITTDEIRAVLDAMRRAGVPAHEASALIDSERVARREHGPVDNFGAFVQSQLAAGKRGQELAAAIRTEHARQGKGNAARGGRGLGQDKADTGRGRGGDAQPPGARGAPGKKQDERGRRRPPNG